MMRRERWRKLIQPESKNNVGGGIKQNKKWDQRREEVKKKKRREEKAKGPLAVALSGTIWHLTTDAHELNKLSFPFLCQFPRSPPPTTRESSRQLALITAQMMEGRRGVKKKSLYETAYVNYIVVKDT